MHSERQMIVEELPVYWRCKEAQTFLNEKLNVNWKNSEQSQKLRKEGNDLYRTASNALQMEETYKLYSKSIAFAESDSEELASSYGNRSAILFRMKKYKECIADIDLAIKIKNSEKFKIKLLCRKIECINLLGDVKSEDTLDEVKALISAMNEEAKVKEEYKRLYEKSKSVKVTTIGSTEKKEIPSPKHVKIFKDKEKENPFDSVSIKWSEKYGRHLVANKDFNAGEIVFIEKSYVKVPNLKNFHMYCGHCLACSWATIPCDYCNWCMFCSEECKKTSWEQYHSIECSVVSQIINNRDSLISYEQTSIRALLLGIKDAGGIQNLKSQIKSVDICTDKSVKGFKNNGSCKAMGLQSMYSLNDAVDLSRLPKYTRNSIFILLSLIKLTSLFDTSLELNLKKILNNDEVLFIGSILLKLQKVADKCIQQLPGEDSHMMCKYSNSLEVCCSTRCCNRGFSTPLIVSLINNSCHPQVTNVINNQSQFIVCSLRPIKKHSQIFLSYCGNYFEMKKATRQFILRSGFNFTCNCEACKKNWPTMQELTMSIQRNPAAFNLSKEIFHAYANDAFIRPLIENFSNAKCTLNMTQTLSKAISKAYEDLQHPSIALFKLEHAMKGFVEKLYENC